MSDLCRFCGYKETDLLSLHGNEIVNKFYKILPVNITRDDVNLPQNFCQLCNLKMVEILEFFDRVAEVDQYLRRQMDFSSIISDSSVTVKDDLVKEAIEKIKIKNEISLKLVGGHAQNSYEEYIDPLDISYNPTELSIKDEMKADSSSATDDDDDPSYKPSPDYKTTDLKTKEAKIHYISHDPVELISEEEMKEFISASDEEEDDQSYAPKKVRKKHELIVIDVSNPNYVCCRCRQAFHTAALLRNHLFVASACHDAELTCKYCNKKFTTRRKRAKHENFHERKELTVHHQCTDCTRKFLSPALLAIHRLKCSGDSPAERLVRPFKCTECGELLKSSAQLMKHTDNHAISKKIRKHLSCEICGQTYDTKPLYHDHIKSHPEMAKYGCNLCDKKFHTAKQLHTHKYEHSGIKSNICQDCGKAFVKKISLNNHRRREHTGEKPFPCQICSTNFPTRERLRIHQYKHIFKD